MNIVTEETSVDRYLTFFARSSQGVKEWRVRTYGTPSAGQIDEINEAVKLWAWPDADCSMRLLDEPYLEGVLSYEPVNGFLNCRGAAPGYPENPSPFPRHG